MSKPKKKFGLQKDFSKIFEGVWIPPKPRGKGAPAQPDAQHPPSKIQNPALAPQDTTVETPKAVEQEQPTRAPVIDELKNTPEPPSLERQDYAADNAATIDEQAPAIEMPLQTDPAEQPNPDILKIAGSMKCSKGFVCYKSNFNQLCKVRNIGEGKVIECSPVNQGPCVYRFSFMGKIFCKCPLRYYIARNLDM